MVRQNLERVRRQIAVSARSAGRDPAGIRLVAVTKGVPVERIREAVDYGVTEIGENRVQEAAEKRPELGRPVAWHLIGPLQRNKARSAMELFDVIHSVDSVEQVRALDRLRLEEAAPGASAHRLAARKLEVLIQVNVPGETTQHGCRPEEAEPMAGELLRCSHLRLIGLMTMAPYSENPEDSRPFFCKLRELRDTLEGRFRSSLTTQDSRLHLSMGMSRDFEVAVQEGATMVRIGTAIFNEERT